MLRYVSLYLSTALFLCLLGADPAAAQTRDTELVSQVTANRFGLQRAWFTQIALDRSRGRVAHLSQHVSATTVFQLAYDGGKIVIGSGDLDASGAPIGKQTAQQHAEKKLEELNQANLHPRLSSQVFHDVSLYVMTDQGVVQSIDGETGRTRWTTAVGSPRRFSEIPAANSRFVAAVNGSDLYVLDKNDGKLAWQQRLRNAPGAGPAVADDFVLVPMVDGKVESYQLDDYRQPPWIFKSHGRIAVPPICTGANVAWTTDLGFLYVGAGDSQAIRYRLETSGTITCAAAYLPPDRIVVASTDGYVYCVQEGNGTVLWRFSTGEPIDRSPVVIGDALYIVTNDDNLFRLSSAEGKEQWLISGVRSFVAGSQDRIYCIDNAGRLTIVEVATGTRIGSLPTETLDLVFVNGQTDRIFLGRNTGTIQCLREIEHEHPIIHPGVVRERTAATRPVRPKKKTETAAEKAPEEKPPAANPFGTIESPKAKPAPKTTVSDPFSTPDASGSGSPPPKSKPPSKEPPGGDPFAP
jgi:outer membrane protein assembly factor BamB